MYYNYYGYDKYSENCLLDENDGKEFMIPETNMFSWIIEKNVL